jgi:hypothetical protein
MISMALSFLRVRKDHKMSWRKEMRLVKGQRTEMNILIIQSVSEDNAGTGM